MKTSSRLTPILAVPAFALIFSLAPAFGQASKVDGQKPAFDDIESPQFSGGKQKSFKPGDWLEIEAELQIDLAPEPPSKTCDRITIKWYVAVKNPDKPSTFLLLTKDIEHVNVPTGEKVVCSVYLSPASIKRLTGSTKAGKNSVEYVGYEVLVNGEKKMEETNKGKPGWWNTGSDKISRSETVPLLTKAQTPFADMWWDRYAELGEVRR